MSQIVCAYLAAVVVANLIVTAFGPGASVLTAFALIGLNITARDRLHDAWSGRGLRWKMGALIAAGGLLSWMVNRDAARIALASSVAFAASETLDALVYQALHRRSWYQRVNGSNVVGAAADSLIFPALAFGGFLPLVMLGQFAAKTVGGALWAWVLKPYRLAVAALLIAAPLQGQFLSAGGGYLRGGFVSEPVAEVVIGSPALLGFRVTSIVSWTFGGSLKPVVVPQVGRDLLARGPALLGADAGLVLAPWTDYADPHPTISARLFWFLPLGLKAVAVAGVQPWHDDWSLVLKLDRTLWWRR